MLKQVQAYQTSDGRVFATQAEAANWERTGALVQHIEANCGVTDPAVVAQYITANWSFLTECFRGRVTGRSLTNAIDLWA